MTELLEGPTGSLAGHSDRPMNIEVVGGTGSGKTTLWKSVIAEFHNVKHFKDVIYVTTRGSYASNRDEVEPFITEVLFIDDWNGEELQTYILDKSERNRNAGFTTAAVLDDVEFDKIQFTKLKSNARHHHLTVISTAQSVPTQKKQDRARRQNASVVFVTGKSVVDQLCNSAVEWVAPNVKAKTRDAMICVLNRRHTSVVILVGGAGDENLSNLRQYGAPLDPAPPQFPNVVRPLVPIKPASAPSGKKKKKKKKARQQQAVVVESSDDDDDDYDYQPSSRSDGSGETLGSASSISGSSGDYGQQSTNIDEGAAPTGGATIGVSRFANTVASLAALAAEKETTESDVSARSSMMESSDDDLPLAKVREKKKANEAVVSKTSESDTGTQSSGSSQRYDFPEDLPESDDDGAGGGAGAFYGAGAGAGAPVAGGGAASGSHPQEYSAWKFIEAWTDSQKQRLFCFWTIQ